MEQETVVEQEEVELVPENRRRYKTFKIRDIPPQAQLHEVKRAIAKAYHSVVLDHERWRRRTNDKGDDGCTLPRFEITLFEDDRGTGRLRSSGWMLVPSWGTAFKEYVATNPIQIPFAPDWNRKDEIVWQAIKLIEDFDRKASPKKISNLLTSPWQDPLLELQHKQRLASLTEYCEIQEIQFGFDHFRQQTKKNRNGKQPTAHRFFVEWARKFADTDVRAHLEFQDAISSMCIIIGSENTQIRKFCKVRYDSVRDIQVKGATIIFNLWSAPILEEGPVIYDEFNPRSRLAALDEQHRRVISRFATRFRVTFYGEDILQSFLAMSKVVGLVIRAAPKDLDKDDGLAILGMLGHNKTKRRPGDYLDELSDSKIDELNQKWLIGVPYEIAFQIAAMLQNGLLNPIEIRELRTSLEKIAKPSEEIGRMLFLFAQSTPLWTFADRLSHSFTDRFEDFAERFWKQGNNLTNTRKAGWFRSYRATLTPTTIRLSGPFQEQSNGVIRQYDYAADHFLRVNFTDEERLQMRWDRDVKGDVFVKEHIGSFLKKGLNIAGRHFEFLGYSNSGLRDHSVWFVTPFRKVTDGKITSEWITPQKIRNGIADFSLEAESDASAASQSSSFNSVFFGDPTVIQEIKESEKKLRTLPSKLGARLAQAFTTTEPSIELKLNEIEFVRDITVKKPLLDIYATEFTDGYGCISPQIANDIWKALNKDATELPSPAPSTYQVRLGGAKGVVGINPLLEGRKAVLHKSMIKFLSTDCGLHIATKFDHPLSLFLNRPLIAILEHLGVPIDWFLRLQSKAVTDANETLLSISEQAADFLTKRHLGRQYGFPHIMRGLKKYGVSRAEMEDAPHPMLDFFIRSLSVATVYVDRELKYRARIPVPSGLSLVGIADVHLELDEWCVYICTHEAGGDSQYFPPNPTEVDEKGRLYGWVYITRSPSIHPGDVQRFKAVHPPKASLYYKHPMVNSVVFSCKGNRPPASMLGGGDLDGDLFQIIPEADDFKPDVDRNPAAYPTIEPRDVGRPVEIDDIADFVVDYINSDKMGLVSIQHLIISDQSSRSLQDKKCLLLAELHSKAVDFAKSGVPVEFRDLPKKYHRYTPDFQHKETTYGDQTEYYESPRALGVLFRAIKVRTIEQLAEGQTPSRRRVAYNAHPFYKRLVEQCIQRNVARGLVTKEAMEDIRKAFISYSTELRGIRNIYRIGRSPLREEEVFMGTILEQTSQRRSRDDMQTRLREVSGQLVERVRIFFQGYKDESISEKQGRHTWLARCMYGLQIALGTDIAKNAKGEIVKDWEESQCSFGMIALRSAFECLDVLDKRRPDPRKQKLTEEADSGISWGKRQ